MNGKLESMLYRLTIENFGPIRAKQTIDLTISGKVESEPNRQLVNDGVRVPRVAVVLGANASGKTTVLRALSFLADFATQSALYPQERPLNFLPFWEKEARSQETTISAEFYADWLQPGIKQPFRYTLVAAPGPHFVDRLVARETLDFRPASHWVNLIDAQPGKAVLRRDFQRLNSAVPASALTRRNVSVISLLRQFAPQHPVVSAIHASLSSIGSNLSPFHKDRPAARDVAEIYAKDPDALKALNVLVRRADLGIKSVRAEEFPGSGPDTKYWILYFEHEGLTGLLSAGQESQGTMNFVSLFPIVHRTLSTGGLALMDELDSDLHPELLKEIVGWFNDPELNQRNAQLLTTCNNPSVLDFLRKEEIFLASKSRMGVTAVYALKDLPKVRRDANFQRDYLAGRYGAVPHIG